MKIICINTIVRYDNYKLNYFYSYAKWIEFEIHKRGYKCNFENFEKWYEKFPYSSLKYDWVSKDKLFEDWHNGRYLSQCYYNLQEKYD